MSEPCLFPLEADRTLDTYGQGVLLREEHGINWKLLYIATLFILILINEHIFKSATVRYKKILKKFILFIFNLDEKLCPHMALSLIISWTVEDISLSSIFFLVGNSTSSPTVWPSLSWPRPLFFHETVIKQSHKLEVLHVENTSRN